jgi:hypothetical protein
MSAATDHILDDLKANVDSVVETILESDPTDYMTEDALDYEFIIGANGAFLGVEVIFCIGGPTVWFNTRTKRVHGSWGSNEIFRHCDDGNQLYDWMRELYEISNQPWRY